MGRGLKLAIPALFAYAVALIVLMPVLWMVRTAFESPGHYAMEGFRLLPTLFTADHILAVFSPTIMGKLANSVLVTVGATVLALLCGFPAAYALARGGFPKHLDKLFLLFVLLIKLTPPISLAIPLYQILRAFGLLDTLAGLVLVYQVYALPFAIWMLLGFIRDVPVEYEEAAMIDGAGLAQRLLTVVIPITLPGLTATAVFLAILSWNEFLYAMLFIQSPSRFTLPTYIATLITEDGIYWGPLSAIGLVASLPVLALVGFVQKGLTQGFSGGIK